MAGKKRVAEEGPLFAKTCTAAELSEIIGINPRNVLEWARRGVLVKKGSRYEVVPSIRAYTAHLREQAAGRATSGGRNLADEKADDIRIAREIKEIKLAQLRGDVMTREEVSASWSAFAGAVKAAVLSIPGVARMQIPHLTAHDGETMKRICRDKLSDLANEVDVMTPTVEKKALKSGK